MALANLSSSSLKRGGMELCGWKNYRAQLNLKQLAENFYDEKNCNLFFVRDTVNLHEQFDNNFKHNLDCVIPNLYKELMICMSSFCLL